MVKHPDHQRLTTGFARRLKAARLAGGYTQEEFSHLLGIKRDRYAKYELGQAEPPFRILAKVSELTHQSLDTLIGGRAILGNQAMNVVGSPLADIQAVSRQRASWWWKTDKEHKLVEVWHLHNSIRQDGQTPRTLGKTRWDAVGGDIGDNGIWQKHLADLEAHLPFDNFRYPFTARDGSPIEICISGRPVFDSHGKFQGYMGFAFSTAEGGVNSEAQ